MNLSNTQDIKYVLEFSKKVYEANIHLLNSYVLVFIIPVSNRFYNFYFRISLLKTIGISYFLVGKYFLKSFLQ